MRLLLFLQNGTAEVDTPLFDVSLIQSIDFNQRKASFKNGRSPTTPGEGLCMRPLSTGDYDKGQLNTHFNMKYIHFLWSNTNVCLLLVIFKDIVLVKVLSRSFLCVDTWLLVTDIQWKSSVLSTKACERRNLRTSSLIKFKFEMCIHTSKRRDAIDYDLFTKTKMATIKLFQIKTFDTLWAR